MKLFRVHGGVHPEGRKDATRDKAAEVLPLGAEIILPLQQHIGAPARPVVEAGERVLKGQLVAEASGPVSAAIHASTSGTVAEIGLFAVPHPSGLAGPAIRILPDGLDEWTEPMRPLAPDAEPAAIADRVAQAGIVGMGGATFPSAVKLHLRDRLALHTLVMNGAECEPFLTCDDRLMREHADKVAAGVALMARALGVDRTRIAIETNKPEAAAAMTEAVKAFPGIAVVRVPTRYPMGSEKHLVQTLTGIETPARALTADMGVVVHNIATAFAVAEAALDGRPLVDRLVTVSGSAVARPANLRVRIGTPVAEVIAFCGGLVAEPERILAGGPMMGQPLASLDIPTVKGMNGILALTPADTRRGPARSCLRCGTCVSVCPCGLVPMEIAARIRADDLAGAAAEGVLDCIGCGSCAYACPSRIPLTQTFAFAKGRLAAEQRAKARDETIRRLVQSKAQRQERLAARRRATGSELP